MSLVWLPRLPPAHLARYHAPSQRTLHSHIIPLISTRTGLHYAPSPYSRIALRQLSSSAPRAQEKKQPEAEKMIADPATSDNVKASPPAKGTAPQAPLMTRVWKKVKHEAAHYWHGTKLLVSEVRISARLQWKILHGEQLTRRERRQVRPPLRWLRWWALLISCVDSSSALPKIYFD